MFSIWSLEDAQVQLGMLSALGISSTDVETTNAINISLE